MQSLIRTATVILAACVASGMVPRTASAQPHPGGPPTVGVAQVHSAPVTSTSQFVGRIQAIDTVALIARVTAFLDKRLFNGGEEVKQGQLLYVLEQGPFQAQVLAQQGSLTQAQANVRFAALSLKRQQALLHTPAGQQSNLDNAVATQGSNAGSVLTAQGNLQAAQINLAYTEIRAPIDGRISATSVNPGNVVSPTSGTLATVVSQDPMYVIFPVATRDVESLDKKYAASGGLAAAQIHLLLTNGDTYDRIGKLDYVAPTVAANTDTLTLRATIANPERPNLNNGNGDKGGVSTRELVDGAFVTVLISDPHPVQSMLIPRAAVLSDQQGDYVYRVGPKNQALRANIKLGQTIDANQVVLSGLTDGEPIIVDGLQLIHPGATVKPAAPQAGLGDAPSGASSGASAGAQSSAAQQGKGSPPGQPANTPSRH